MPSVTQVIETTAAPRFVSGTSFRLDPELRNQLMALAVVICVLAIFGRDWLHPQPSTANQQVAVRSNRSGGIPVPTIEESSAASRDGRATGEKLPLHGDQMGSDVSPVAALDSRLPPVQPLVRRRPMPFDSPQAVGVRAAAFLPDNVHAMTVHATDKGNLLRNWVIDTGAAVGQPVALPSGRDFHLRFSPNGARLAVTVLPNEHGIMLLNAKTGVTLRTKATKNLPFLSAPAWSGDGMLIYGSPLGTVETWDILTDANKLSLSQGQPVTAVAVSDAGYLLSGDTTGEIRLWSLAENGRYAASYQKLKGPIRVLETRRAGDDVLVLAAAGEQGKNWECHVFDLATQQTLHSIPLVGEITAFASTSDWRRIATGHRHGQVTVWDTLSGDELQTSQAHTGEVTTLVISADNSCVMSGCYQVRNDVTVRLRPLPAPLVRAQDSVFTETQRHDNTEVESFIAEEQP